MHRVGIDRVGRIVGKGLGNAHSMTVQAGKVEVSARAARHFFDGRGAVVPGAGKAVQVDNGNICDDACGVGPDDACFDVRLQRERGLMMSYIGLELLQVIAEVG